MRLFHTIESWASHIGYVVETTNDNQYVWYQEQEVHFKRSHSIEQLVNDILEDLRSRYRGE